MYVRFWGTRGSIATPGPSTLHFGGNTSCVELVTNSGVRFIFDCGTGARALGLDLLANAPKPISANIMLGHTHWDHIQGFPFFAPVFIPENHFTVFAPQGVGRSITEVLSGQMEYTFFPVELGQLPSKIEFRELGEGASEMDGVRVIAQFLHHPTITLGYRIEADGFAVLYLTDHEPFSESLWRPDAVPGQLDSIVHAGDRRHADFMANADLVIHDAQYTPEEYPAKKNWGHSTYDYVVELAAAAGVRQVALTHHDPTHNDEMIRGIEQKARDIAKARGSKMDVLCAYEGCEIKLVPKKRPTQMLDVAAVRAMVAAKVNHVLIVDDDSNLRMLASATLLRDGYTVDEAADGSECMRVLEGKLPDLVLLDLNMPEMGGVDVLKSMRANDRLKSLPVIILTAESDAGSTKEGFDAGASDYLTKPFSVPQLLTRVRACLSRAAE